jgi:hypothetical protein
VTASALEALERLFADIAAHEESAPVARAWSTPSAPLARVAIDPWDDGAIGGADVRFAPGSGPTLAEVADRFGAWGEPPRLTSGTRVLRAEWWREGLPVRVILLVRDPPADDEPLDELTIQRGRWPPAG